MGYMAGYNYDVSNLDSNFYKKLSAASSVPAIYETIELNGTSSANVQIQDALNKLNDLFIDDSVSIVLQFEGISGSTSDATVSPTYHKFDNPVFIDHPVSDRLVIQGIPPSDHSVLGVSYYDAVNRGLITGSSFANAATAAAEGYYAQLIISNGSSLKIGEYLAVYDNRHQKYLNPSYFKFTDTVNGREFATPYPVTAEKLRAALIQGVHKIVDKIDFAGRSGGVAGSTANPANKVDFVTVHIKNPNPTYEIGLRSYGITFARRAFLSPQGIVGRYEQGYGSSAVLNDPLFFSGMTSGATGEEITLPGYRSSADYSYGVSGSIAGTRFLAEIATGGTSGIGRNDFGFTPTDKQGNVVGTDWETYDRLAIAGACLSNPIQNYRDSNDYRAKGYKTIIECESDGFVIANDTKPPELKNILLLSKTGKGHGIRVDNSSSVNLRQIAVVGFTGGAGVFANNRSTVTVLADKFSDPEVFREMGAFSCCNYTGFESRNHSNINASRTVAAGNRFANYYSAENSYINAYAVVSLSSKKYGIVAVGKSFINADSAFSCFNGSDGFFSSNGSLLTINSGRACYNYGNGIHAFSSGEIRSFDVIASSNIKDGIVANDMSTIICGDSSKEPIEWDIKFGYDYRTPYYNFENPTNISQSRFNGISGLAASTDSFINASFFEAYDNSRLGGEWGKLRDVACVYSPTVGYCYGASGSGSSAGSRCDAAYAYCDDAVYSSLPDPPNSVNMNDPLNDKTPTSGSLCIPYADSTGLTAQVPVSKKRYAALVGKLTTLYGGADGVTLGRILACKGYFPGCLLIGQGFDNGADPGMASSSVPSGYSICDPTANITQILEGSTGTVDESFIVANEILACTADTNTVLQNTICITSTNTAAFNTPQRPLTLVLPNYDVEIRDSSKIALAGRIANFGYYDPRSGVRIQPVYKGTDLNIKPGTLVGYAGNKNGSELVITDQTLLEGGALANQGTGTRSTLRNIRYSSEDFLAAAELYDPVPQLGYINTEPYQLNLGKVDPETGALTSSIGITAASVLVSNTSSTPQQTMGVNDAEAGTGYPTY